MSTSDLSAALSAALRRCPQRPAIVEGETGRTVTYAQLDAMVAHLRARLRALGFGPGDVVPIFGARSIATVAIGLAGVLEGGATSWLNPRYRAPQLRRILDVIASPGLLVDRVGVASLEEDEGESEWRARAVWIADDLAPPSIVASGAIISTNEMGTSRARPIAARPVALGASTIVFTSGSSGEPKGVLISGSDILRRATTEVSSYGLGPEDVLLGLLPLSFDVGLNQLFSALLSGAALCLLDRWLRADLARAITRFDITGISATPGVWTMAMRGVAEDEQLFSSAPRLRYVTVSGGSLPASMFARLANGLMPHVGIHRTYGQSETFRSAIFIGANAPEHAERALSVGRAVPGTALHIALDRERLAPPGVRGELLHSGDGTMLGYLGDEAASAAKVSTHAALPGRRVVYTGDEAHIDDEGFVYLAGRADGMIKAFGIRFYPREVEEVLCQHPAVGESIVFGIGDDVAGQRVVAIVSAEESVTVDELIELAAARLPRYMVPTRIHLVAEVPRLSNGKPALAEIKRRFSGENGP